MKPILLVLVMIYQQLSQVTSLRLLRGGLRPLSSTPSLPPHISSIVSLLPPPSPSTSSVLVDVGSDLGLLPFYLQRTPNLATKYDRLIGTDISPFAVNHCVASQESFPLSSSNQQPVEFLLCDGTADVKLCPGEACTQILSGIGLPLIHNLLSTSPILPSTEV
jgi:hypothetical protein